MKKTCNKCGNEKDRSEFYAHKKMADGLLGACKECVKERVRENSAVVGSGYDFSEKGVVRVIYKTQKRNNKIRGHGDMPYTKAELNSWLSANGFSEAYDRWVKSGYSTSMKPSVDRINSLLGYSLDNIQLVTWGKNRSNQADDILSGSGSGGLRCKKLKKMSQDMQVICTYHSYNAAKRDVGHSIEYAIKNGVKCKSGFYWEYVKN